LLEIAPTPTLPSAVDSYPKSITLSGMSKSMGMAGIRLGWLITKDKNLFSRLQQLHDYYSICHAAPSEVGHTAL
jgi:aspartate/methionine/tyrosine aminotransferase